MRDATTLSISLTVLLSVLQLSCRDNDGYNLKATNADVAKTVFSKPGANSSDTLEIDYPAAVFYSPDPKQLASIKNAIDSADFDGIAHEYYYLFRNAQTVLQKNNPEVKIAKAINVRYLLFKTKKIAYCIDLDKKTEPYGLLAFDTIQEPRQLDLANIDTELHFYFSMNN